MSANLTKDADKVLCTLYREYLNRLKNGLPKDEASSFRPSEEIQEELFSDTPLHDLDDSLDELKTAGFIKVNILGAFSLQRSAIIDLEGRFKKGLTEVIEFLLKFHKLF